MVEPGDGAPSPSTAAGWYDLGPAAAFVDPPLREVRIGRLRLAVSHRDGVFGAIHGTGLRNLHGFGLKVLGLPECSQYLASADSMAWSDRARQGQIRLTGCAHRKCNNCLRYALRWRRQVLKAIERPKQGRLFV